MKASEFNQSLMTTKTVFNSDLIEPGMVIKLFRVNEVDGEVLVHPITTGIITEADPIMIQYSYYSKSKSTMQNAYLHSSDIYMENVCAEQWVGKESLYLFQVE